VSERPVAYVRVYYSIIDDPKFVDIYDDDHHLAAWLRLLLGADAVWPASAHLPTNVRRASVRALVDVGLVDVSGHRYRLHGLDAERERRGQSGRNAAAMRWQSDRIRTSDADPMPSLAKPSKDEQRLAEARADDPADAYWQLTGRFPTEKTLTWVDDLSAKFGGEAVIRAIVKAYTADRSTATLLGRAQDQLRSEARELDRKEREDEQRRLAEKRAVPRVLEPWRAELRQQLLEEAS
jgi:hypothetical protein